MKKFKLKDLSKSTGEVFIFHKLIPELKIQVITNDNFEYNKWDDVYDLFHYKNNEIAFVIVGAKEDLNEVSDYTPYQQVLKRAWKWYRSKVFIEENIETPPQVTEDNNYILQPSTDPDKWICTDKLNGIVTTWQTGLFNSTQVITYLNDVAKPDVMTIARQQRQLADWLIKYHKEKI